MVSSQPGIYTALRLGRAGPGSVQVWLTSNGASESLPLPHALACLCPSVARAPSLAILLKPTIRSTHSTHGISPAVAYSGATRGPAEHNAMTAPYYVKSRRTSWVYLQFPRGLRLAYPMHSDCPGCIHGPLHSHSVRRYSFVNDTACYLTKLGAPVTGTSRTSALLVHRVSPSCHYRVRIRMRQGAHGEKHATRANGQRLP